MSWLTTKLLGVRYILLGGSPLPERQSFNFVAGATVVDNPALKTTDITIDANSVFTDATPSAIPNTIVKRNFGGGAGFDSTCDFVGISATGNVGITGNLNVSTNCVVTGTINCFDKFTCGDDIQTSSDVICSDLTATNGIFCPSANISGTLTAQNLSSIGNIVTGSNILAVSNISSTTGTISAPNASIATLLTAANLNVGGASSLASATLSGTLSCSTYTSYIGSALFFSTPAVSNAVGSGITIKTGNVTAASSPSHVSGLVKLQGGSSVANTGPWYSISILGGIGLGANSHGGSCYILGGAATGAAGISAGSVDIQGGSGPVGGDVNIIGGGGSDSGTVGGHVIIKGGLQGSFRGNIGLGGDIGTHGLTLGSNCVFIKDAVSVPSANPPFGGILFVESGALKYRGSSGTVTTIANA